MNFKSFYLAMLLGLAASPAFALVNTPDAAKMLKQQWLEVKAAPPGVAQKEAFAALSAKADALQQDFPDHSAVLLWRGTILSSYAAATGGRPALSMVAQARDLLEQSLAQAPEIEQGLAYGVLGSLYSRVPAWPVSFRDMAKARKYLEKGLALYPDNPDLQYYYGDFLRLTKAYTEAQQHLQLALEKGPSPARRTEIEASLAQVRQQLHG